MPIISLRNGKYPKKFLFLSVCGGIVGTVICMMFGIDWRVQRYGQYNGTKYSTSVKTTAEMQRLAEQFGIVTDSKPLRVEKVKIPQEFNDIYEKYNRLQYDIGMDLSAYKGEECMKYTFAVNDDKVINLLVYNDRFIGGDISDKEFSGTMKGLGMK